MLELKCWWYRENKISSLFAWSNADLIRSHTLNAYTQAAAFTKTVWKSCEVESGERFCNLYQYADLSNTDEIIKLKVEKPGRPFSIIWRHRSLAEIDYKAVVVCSSERASILLRHHSSKLLLRLIKSISIVIKIGANFF